MIRITELPYHVRALRLTHNCTEATFTDYFADSPPSCESNYAHNLYSIVNPWNESDA